MKDDFPKYFKDILEKECVKGSVHKVHMALVGVRSDNGNFLVLEKVESEHSPYQIIEIKWDHTKVHLLPIHFSPVRLRKYSEPAERGAPVYVEERSLTPTVGEESPKNHVERLMFTSALPDDSDLTQIYADALKAIGVYRHRGHHRLSGTSLPGTPQR